MGVCAVCMEFYREPSCGIPWLLGCGMLIARSGTDGLTPHSHPCVSLKDLQKKKAFKIKKMNFLYAKLKTRIACLNVCTLGTLGDQSHN